MRTNFKLDTNSFGTFDVSITSKLINTNVVYPHSDGSTRHNQFRLTVTVNNTKEVFDYYDSHLNQQNNVESLEDKNHINAFDGLIGDALSALHDFTSFCNTYGFEPNSERAEFVYKSCNKIKAQLERLFTGATISVIANRFQEQMNP